MFVLIAFSVSESQPQTVNAAKSQSGASLEVADLDGGSVVTDLGYKIRLNEGSSLHRHWIVINDPSAPVKLAGVGVKAAYHAESYGGEYRYLPAGTASPKVPIQAIETRLMLFDVWGQHLKTLSSTEVKDFPANSTIDLSKVGNWRTFENEASEMLSVVSFVANVRLEDGTIWTMDTKKILGEVGRIKIRLSENDLTPEKTAPKP
jgi:hypothetical protein